MTSKRPIELSNYIDAVADTNDELIMNALIKLGDPKARGKRKPSVEVISKMTGLSRNTVRNRAWALERLKAIKIRLKSELEEAQEVARNEDNEVAILDKLRKRIKDILDQNGLLYEEILSLHQIIKNKDAQINKLKK